MSNVFVASPDVVGRAAPEQCGVCICAGPMIDSLAIGLKECRQRRGMSEHVRLDHFLDGMLQARITRRIIAEQHISMASLKPNYIGIVDTALHVRCELCLESLLLVEYYSVVACHPLCSSWRTIKLQQQLTAGRIQRHRAGILQNSVRLRMHESRTHLSEVHLVLVFK